MVRNRDLRKYISSVVLIMFMLSLMMVQAPVSLAKTLQTPIADPSNDTVALNVIIGGETLPYTWGDIIGAAGYKFAGKATSDTYLAEEETCDGIKFSDLLANVESTLGITLQDTYNIQAVCSDAYSNQPFTVAEAKDYETNHYLLAYKVNGVSEACIGYKDSDPSVTYPATYLRIARNRGGDFSTDGFGRSAYMRLISSINITKSDGSAVELAPQGTVGEKEPGGDVSNSVFYIAVKDASGETKYYYYTKAELETYETQSAYTYNDHGVIKTVTCKGALLKDLLANLKGVSIKDDMIVQYAEEDAYHADAKTDVIDSNYKDTIESLTKPTLDGSGNTKNPMRPIVTYAIHEEYADPDAYNVNDPAGEFKDPDPDSFAYTKLRAYRDTGGANSAVIKYLMGVVVSTDGALLSGKNGCLVTSVSDKNPSIKVRDDITIKGLLPGMQYAVKAPAATNANLATGQTSPVLITVGSGVPADQTITFQYTEDTYFYVNNALTGKITNYTYTDLIAEHEQVPDANANTAPYGYSRPMYYRYNGVWLSDLVSGISGNYSIKLVAKDGTKTDITDNIALYFIAYNNTRSKTSTNIPEGKRVTDTYNDAKIIIPSTGENITGSAADDYTTAGKDVDVLMAAAEGLEITEGAPVLPGFELWPMQTASKLDKTWTIKFNQAVDKDTVVADNIYVTDNYNVKTVETTLIISKDLKSVQVTPKADYTPNQEYRLYISNELQAKDSQKNLNKSLVMPFKINNN